MKYFGTDGIRGVYGRTITEQLAFKIGLAAAYLCGEIIVARDTRVSGKSLSDALISGLVRGGADVVDIGVMPTPALSYLCRKRSMYGIMVTASHNPPSYNGFKFFMRDGYKPTPNFETAIETCSPSYAGGGKKREENAIEEYCEYAASGFNLRGIEVALDCAYGATSEIAPVIFEMAGAKVVKLSCLTDGEKINVECGATDPHLIVGKKLAFAFDGDGDRAVMASDGDIVDGDSVLYSLFCLTKPTGVVGTVMSNSALSRAIINDGGKFVATAVGDRAVAFAMRRLGYELGGEKSGHYIISPNRSGDGIYSALRLCTSKVRRLDLLPCREFSVDGGDAEGAARKFVVKDARVVIRRSGTEPKVRVMAECENEEKLDELCSRIKNYLEEK